MKIGGYDLYSIETSRFGLDGGAMFGIIPKLLWEKEAPADDKNQNSYGDPFITISGSRSKNHC